MEARQRPEREAGSRAEQGHPRQVRVAGHQLGPAQGGQHREDHQLLIALGGHRQQLPTLSRHPCRPAHTRYQVISRDRPKSAPYLKHKNSKRTSKCQTILFYSTRFFFWKRSQNAKKIERGTLWSRPVLDVTRETLLLVNSLQVYRKKVAWCRKKVGLRGILSVFSRSWTCFVFSFRFGRASEVRVFWTSIVQVVEQMNKKVDLTRVKKTLPTVRVGYIF